MGALGQAHDQVLVAGICGSLRPCSYTRRAVGEVLGAAEELGVQTALIDLREYQLPFCDGKENERIYPADVFKLRDEVRAAQGLILGTPEYHGSFSGLLKNALDLMGFDEFEGKMIGLVGVSGGIGAAIEALNGLRSVGRALHAWVIPHQVGIPTAGSAFDETGTLRDAELRDRLRQLGQQVARFACLHMLGRGTEFLQQWERAHVNPGGNVGDTSGHAAVRAIPQAEPVAASS